MLTENISERIFILTIALFQQLNLNISCAEVCSILTGFPISEGEFMQALLAGQAQKLLNDVIVEDSGAYLGSTLSPSSLELISDVSKVELDSLEETIREFYV